VTRVDLVKIVNKFINLQGYDIRTKEGWEYVHLYSNDRSPTESRVSLQCDECVFFKNLLNQYLNRSLVSELDREIGLNYLRGMHLSDSKATYILNRQNIGL
jgi:hypothetical protein